jgi:hypothetical protein
MFEWVKRLLKRHVIDDTPVELAECEFGCRVEQCEYGKWRSCENRIRVMNQLTAFSQMKLEHDSAATQADSKAAR